MTTRDKTASVRGKDEIVEGYRRSSKDIGDRRRI